jgi:SAM-dependent methyltransferase
MNKSQIINFLNKYPKIKKTIIWLRPPSLKFDLNGKKNRAYFSKALFESGVTGHIIDIGSGPIKDGNIRGLSSIIMQRRKAMDYIQNPGVDIIGSVENIPIKDCTVAGVLFQGVIEHIGDPQKAISEIYRVLKPGGYIYVEAPFLQHFHYDPEDNYRFTDDGLEKIFSLNSFEIIKKGSLYGPSAVLADVLIEYISIIFRHPILYWVVKWIVGWFFFWIKYFDILFIKNPLSKYLSFGVYIIGRKK